MKMIKKILYIMNKLTLNFVRNMLNKSRFH